jgi:hypothetical protein
MAEFDPDAYLAKSKPVEFDPDAYLAKSTEAQQAKVRDDIDADRRAMVDEMHPAMRFLTGMGGGFVNVGRNVADMAGHIPGLESIRPNPQDWSEENARAKPLFDSTEGKIGKATGEIAAFVPMSMAAEMAAPALAAAAPSVARAVPWALAGGEGALQGGILAGPGHRTLGSLVGLASGVGAKAIGSGLSALGNKFFGKGAERIAAGEARAAEMGAEAANKATMSARSQAGQDAQALYRALEHIEALRKNGSPEALAQLAELERSGVIDQIQKTLFAKTVEELPSKLATSQASRQAFQEMSASEAQRATDATAGLAQSSVGRDLWSLAKSYGEPVAGAAAGSVLGPAGAMAGTLGGLIFGRTRAGKAIVNRVMRPGNQIALGKGQIVLEDLLKYFEPTARQAFVRGGLQAAENLVPGLGLGALAGAQ